MFPIHALWEYIFLASNSQCLMNMIVWQTTTLCPCFGSPTAGCLCLSSFEVSLHWQLEAQEQSRIHSQSANTNSTCGLCLDYNDCSKYILTKCFGTDAFTDKLLEGMSVMLSTPTQLQFACIHAVLSVKFIKNNYCFSVLH